MIYRLTESPYIYFNSNPVTDQILNNRQSITDEFFTAANYRKLTWPDKTLITNTLVLNTQISKKTNDVMYTGAFKSITLYMTSNFLDEPEKKEANWKVDEKERFATELLDLMPWTKSFILEHKDIIGAYNFNISYPGSRLVHHLGLDSNYIRLHYCIKASDHCVFDIEGWRHVWKEGELFGFDDGNVFHGTDHKKVQGSEPRIILMIDMLKDYLQPYAKTWPCRQVTPTKKDVELKGWDD